VSHQALYHDGADGWKYLLRCVAYNFTGEAPPVLATVILMETSTEGTTNPQHVRDGLPSRTRKSLPVPDCTPGRVEDTTAEKGIMTHLHSLDGYSR
jgi:hypothetical protein